MLQRLSATSPYVCDLNRGPIEPANRMASRSSKKLTSLLESKESISKTRTPLKLLGRDEIPIDTTMAANDINASLQPVWYTEQTIIDDHHAQQEDNRSMIQDKSRTTLLRSTLPPIQSESGLNNEEEEVEPLASQPSLMHKSSTFTIESSMNMESALSDLEKENLNKEDPMPSMTAPSDESFRALEHLLGLGSGATTMRESPKPNHDTLSLTVVTPTDIVNSTRRSSRLSLAQKTITDSLPSSQELPKMPTIESIASITLPSFLADNTTIADEQPSTTMNQQDSFDLTENNSKNDDEGNFSFELNDFTNSTKNESMMAVPEPAVQPPMPAMRAPTCADVAYRALIKPRLNGRVSQPIKADSPLAVTNKARSSAPASRFLRSSCRRISSDSAAQNSDAQEQPMINNECFVNNEVESNTEKQQDLVEIVSVPEEDEMEQEKSMSVTLNLNSSKRTNQNVSKQADETYQSVASEQEQLGTSSNELAPLLSREYTYNTPKRRSSQRSRSMLNVTANSTVRSQQKTINEEQTKSPSIASKSMLNVLLTQKSTEKTPKSPSVASKSMLNVLLTQQPTEKTPKSPAITSKSMLNVLLTQQPTEQTTLSPMKSAVGSPSIASKSMLGVLLTQPTEVPARTSTRKSKAPLTPVLSSADSPSIASESMLGILLTKPTQTEARPSKRNSKILTPSKSAFSSPSIVSKSMLGILLTQPTEGEQSLLQDTLSTSIKSSSDRMSSRPSKRLSTNLTPRVSINPLHSSTPSTTTRQKSLQLVSIGEQEQILTTVPAQQEIDIIQLNDSIQSVRQSTPPSRTMDAGVQTTPSLNYVSRRYFDSIDQDSTSIIEMNKSSSSVIVQEKQITPLQTKIIMNLKRNVRFQLTPTTDARLTEKEKLEETLRGLKPDIVINPTAVVVPQVVKAEVKKPVKRLKKPKKKLLTLRKKKTVSNKKTQEIKPVSSKKESKAKVESAPSKRSTQRKRAGAEVTVEPVVAKRSKTSKPAEVRVASSKARTASTNNKKSKVAESTKRQRSVSKTNEKKKVEPKKQKTTPAKVEKQTASKTKKEETPVVVKVDKPEPKRTASKSNKKNTETTATKTTPKQTRSASANVKKNTTEEKRSVFSASNEIQKVEVVEPKRKSLKSNKKTKPESVEKPQEIVLPTNITEPVEKKRSASLKNKKTTAEPTKERESRAQSRTANNKKEIVAPVEEKVEKKTTESVKKSKKTEVKPVETKQEQPEKLDELTVAELKSRLTKQKQDVPKGAKKADLIALLMKNETNVVKEQKPVEAPVVRTTRRHKK